MVSPHCEPTTRKHRVCLKLNTFMSCCAKFKLVTVVVSQIRHWTTSPKQYLKEECTKCWHNFFKVSILFFSLKDPGWVHIIVKVYLFIYLGFYVAFNTVQVISRGVVGRAEETSTYSSLGFCTVNC